MPCLVAVLALVTPRFVLVAMFLFTDYLARAFDTFLWPLLGFFLMPTTTIAYSYSINTFGGVQDLGLIAVVVAVLFDLGVVGGGSRARRRR